MHNLWQWLVIQGDQLPRKVTLNKKQSIRLKEGSYFGRVPMEFNGTNGVVISL